MLNLLLQPTSWEWIFPEQVKVVVKVSEDFGFFGEMFSWCNRWEFHRSLIEPTFEMMAQRLEDALWTDYRMKLGQDVKSALERIDEAL